MGLVLGAPYKRWMLNLVNVFFGHWCFFCFFEFLIKNKKFKKKLDFCLTWTFLSEIIFVYACCGLLFYWEMEGRGFDSRLIYFFPDFFLCWFFSFLFLMSCYFSCFFSWFFDFFLIFSWDFLDFFDFCVVLLLFWVII